MKEANLKLAQQDIDEALSAIETMEETMDNENMSTDSIRENFIFVSEKLHQLELILKEEGIL
jgi:hypothetical protein